MSQQAQFEEEFRDGPPLSSYQGGYTGPQPVAYTPPVLPPSQSYAHMPGQKLQVHDMRNGQAPSVGARLALAIVSMIFVFVMYMITLVFEGSVHYWDNSFMLSSLAVFFALLFTGVVVLLNILFNRKR